MNSTHSAIFTEGARAPDQTADRQAQREDGRAGSARIERHSRPPFAITIAKNTLALVLAVGLYFGFDSGYFSPDRPTRDQWDRLQSAKARPTDEPIYTGDLRGMKPGSVTRGTWGRYNGATETTAAFTADGIKVDYKDAAWLGAVFDLATFTPGRIYRITFDAEVKEQPAAIIVRNRQLDLMREQISVGSGTRSVHVVSPQGNRDRMRVIFIPDAPSNPKGQMTITSLKIEAVRE
jgi:hypothetical protein